MLQRTLDFIKGVIGNQEKVVMVHNTRPYLENREAIQISQDKFDDHLVNSLSNNKRVVNISSSRTDLSAIAKTRILKSMIKILTRMIYEMLMVFGPSVILLVILLLFKLA